MDDFYTHRLKVVKYDELSSIIQEKLIETIKSSCRYPIVEREKIIEEIREKTENSQNFLFENDMGLNEKIGYGWIKEIADELRTNNLYFYLRSQFSPQLMDDTLKLQDAYDMIINMYSTILFNKGMELITGKYYNFSSTTIKSALSQSEKEVDKEAKEYILELYLYPYYFKPETRIMRGKSVKEDMQEVLIYYFRVLKTYISNGIIEEDLLNQKLENIH